MSEAGLPVLLDLVGNGCKVNATGFGRVARSGQGDAAAWQPVLPRECARCGRRVTGRARYCSTCSLMILQEGAGAQPP